MFDKLHVMYIILFHSFIHSFIHSFASDSFVYLFIEFIYLLFIYLSDRTFIHLTFEDTRTSNLRITHAELHITYAELCRCMWNFCGNATEFRNALRNSAKVSQHAEFVPHPTSEYFPHLYGKFAENSDLVFLHRGTMRKIST